LKTRVFSVLLVASLAFVVPVSGRFDDSGGAPGFVGTSAFFFRNFGEVHRNENDSIIILDGAYPQSPSSTSPSTIEFKGNVRQEAQVFLSTVVVWLGGISWLTPPAEQNVDLSGSITFHVWLESDDAEPSASGIGVGVLVLDSQGAAVGDPVYSYQYKFGNYLTPAPSQYTLSVSLSRSLAVGQRIAFSVGAGSTIEGWRVKVTFDSVTFDSRTEMPTTVYVVPEYADGAHDLVLALASLFVVVVSFQARGRKR
jgi:hypothetical protein